ncbi:MAG: hypothetical protein NTV38_12125 [Chloroflexi bacterium]|nr:hypothetical protein [Chloroflexota bacterium]
MTTLSCSGLFPGAALTTPPASAPTRLPSTSNVLKIHERNSFGRNIYEGFSSRWS